MRRTSMRTIKFRGRRLDAKGWAVGHLVKMWGAWHIIDWNDENTAYAVDPATVGQYTGLKDKDSKEIWEGDIILTQGQVHKFIQVVEFHNTHETCGRGWVGVNHKTLDNFGHDNPVQGGFSYFPMPCHCEIIGNIHYNPELLKGGEQ